LLKFHSKSSFMSNKLQFFIQFCLDLASLNLDLNQAGISTAPLCMDVEVGTI
jgi:hypothetical protein